MKIQLSLIRPSPRPVRSSWDKDKLEELTQSIREQGLIVPVKVRPVGEEYELVYGHRRVEAARRAGLEEIEAIVEGVDDTTALIQALIENVQREGLAPLDKARALRALVDETGWSPADIEHRGIMDSRYARYFLALLEEPEEIQTLVMAAPDGRTAEGKVTEFLVRSVRESGLPPSERVHVVHKAAEEGLTARQTRRVADTIAATPDPDKRKALLETDARSPIWEEMATRQVKAKKQKQAEWWDKHPSTKKLLELFGMYKRVLKSTWESAREEKIAPEHLPYLIKRIRGIIADLQGMVEQLEAKAAKYHQ